MKSLVKSTAAEFFGTAILVMVVVGSGIMGTNLSPDTGVALLINMFSTVLALGLLIFILGPLSGAHFNPIVTFVFLLRRTIEPKTALSYVAAQIAGAIAGAVVANAMFDLNAIQKSTHVRSSLGLWLGEVVASAGLIIVIFTLIDRQISHLIPIAVPVWIGSAYLFTSSTSFANPAVTIGRIFSDTFAGIASASVLGFIIAQLIGALLGAAITTTLGTKS